MKTKIFLLVCLFLGIGLIRLSAQIPLPPNGKTGAISWYEEWDGYSIPVYIDGVLVDELSGFVKMHNVAFVQNGVPIHGSQHMYGEIQSSNPPYEVFKVSDMSHFYFNSEILNFRTAVIGNFGTHYIMYFSYDTYTGEIISDKTMVVGKNK